MLFLMAIIKKSATVSGCYDDFHFEIFFRKTAIKTANRGVLFVVAYILEEQLLPVPIRLVLIISSLSTKSRFFYFYGAVPSYSL